MENRNKRRKTAITISAFVCFIGFTLLLVLVVFRSPKRDIVSYFDESINPIDTIELSDTGYPDSVNGFTCTGLCYDATEEILWIGNYGKLLSNDKEMHPSIIGISAHSGMFLKEIELSNIIDSESPSIQGVAYEEDDDTLWFTDSLSVYHIKKDGSLIEKLNLGRYAKYIPNGLAYDKDRGTLWVLFYNSYLVEYDKSAKVVKSYHINFKDQDQLTVENEQYLLASVGADYNGQNNYILRIDKDTGHVECVIRAVDSFAIEGLCIANNRLYVANDGLFHAAAVDTNRLLIYGIGD